ncbi:MAG TPA: transketolase, partial [Acidimicrobiaceae bacterium]|nr:transketolase [Acidimicrobiaceae bacterium]
EAASFAGHQKLGNLIAIYDDNRITIDGETNLTVSDDPQKRFEAYGWHVINIGDAAEDLSALEFGLKAARDETQRPSLLIMQSHIGYPAPNAVDTPGAHGAITDDSEIFAAKSAMGVDPDAKFEVDPEVLSTYREAGQRGASQRLEWLER